MMSRPDKFVD